MKVARILLTILVILTPRHVRAQDGSVGPSTVPDRPLTAEDAQICYQALIRANVTAKDVGFQLFTCENLRKDLLDDKLKLLQRPQVTETITKIVEVPATPDWAWALLIVSILETAVLAIGAYVILNDT